MIERRTIASREEWLMQRWADATRHHQWDQAALFWQQLMAQRLTAPVVDQRYWNDLLDRKMAALERRAERSAIDDIEWDNTHQDMGR